MIPKIFAEIEEKIQGAKALNPERKRQLLQLLATLKTEILHLSRSDHEQAQSIAGFTRTSTHEATREKQNPTLLQHSLNGLRASVAGFEQSHPRLVQIVNRLCNTLSDLGI
ncbi:MAG TPA: DUF4404 family protein [Verrucomicrobiae bacterium]|nr:DUF4404 family protein [Verrucomicrobiae bacterium]